MKQLIIFIGIVILSACSQKEKANSEFNTIEITQCNCLENWHWMKETFENNDAGFQWVIEKKGLERYKQFCDSIEYELKNATDINDCQRIMNDWGMFFRKGHFFIGVNQTTSGKTAPAKSETVDYSIETVNEQIENLKDPMIGVWQSSPYKIGIVRDTMNIIRKYVGFIIESEVPEWKKGDVKVEFFDDYSAHFYMQDRSVERRNVWLKNEVELFVGNMKFVNTLKADTLEQQLLATSKPLFFNLSDETTLLRVPSFNLEHKESINTLIEDNKKTILSHKNFIIDLRDNGGGADNSWQNIIPFIYTNPIKTIGVEFYSTPLNRELYFSQYSFIQRLIDHKFILKSKRNNGKFVARDSIIVTKLETVYPNPQQVIVLVDEACGSSTEQFILAVQESSKTIIYGERTYGALDASNVVTVSTPDNCFSLGYCVTRTLRPIENRIDDVGITPDVIISDSIPKYKWIDFVLEELNKK